MSTTSLKLPDALKESIQDCAAEENISAHAFMVRTLESEVRRRRLRTEFLADAHAAAAEIDAGGPVYALEDIRDWIKARIRSRATGDAVAEPKPVRGSEAALRKPKRAA